MSRVVFGVVVMGLATALLAPCAFADDVRVVVGFKGSTAPGLVEARGGKIHRRLRGAVAATLPAAAVASLRAQPDVAYVEEDGFAEVLGRKGAPAKALKKPSSSGPSQPAESLPWGVDRVDAPLSGNVGAGIKVAVIDTGIDLDHPDLVANVAGAVDFVKVTGDDDNGHGSHVAGTIAAVDNTIGVIGVAPGASLYAVKVLDRRGSGFLSDVAAGIEWAAEHGMDVANMSLGGSSGTTALSGACAYAVAADVVLVAAAGNSGDGSTVTTETSYPAAYATVIAVGATTSSDGLASFSNTGPYLEVSAPGVGVTSTTKGGAYATYNGTSMASPHAAGITALLWYELRGAGTPTGPDVRAELITRIRDKGAAGWDAGFGYGIVDFDR